MGMHKNIILIVAIAFVFSIVWTVAIVAQSPPPLPGEFYGNITINGKDPAVGTVIIAKVDGVERGRFVTTTTGAYGSSKDEDKRLIIEGTETDIGKNISFLIDGVQANERVTYKSGESIELNLTAAKAPSPCYIATATYGTPLDSRIDILRDFRDELLLTNPIGEAFVSTYYRTSPPIADALRENDGLRTVTRLTLITPLVYLSKSLLSGILVTCIFIIGLTAVFLTKTERMKIVKPLLVGAGSSLLFIAAIFSLGFVGYAIPFCAAVGAYMLPFVIPLSAVFTICTVLKMRVNVSDNIKKHAWNSKV